MNLGNSIRIGGIALLVVLNLPAVTRAGGSTPTREQRIAGQKAAEAVYWKHRLWPAQNRGPKPELDAVLPAAVIESRVDDAARKSNALEIFWNRPITSRQLDAEVRRMARESRAPDVLRELFDALGDDSALVAEVLARPALADTLLRRWYRTDERLGVAAEGGAKQPFEVWWSETAPSIPTSLRSDPGAASAETAPAVTAAPCSPDTWTSTRFLPAARAGHVSVWTGSEVLVWGAITYADGSIPGGRYDPATDSWRTLSSVNQPHNRTKMTAVWTGTEMVVWGGFGDMGTAPDLESGGRYDPQTDSWRPTSIAPGVPAPRDEHSAVWTGSVMIVWGGDSYGSPTNTGARYDPVADSWQPTSTAGAPTARSGHDAVWTGSRMVVWGGGTTTGGRYDPSTDTWTATSTLDAPEARVDDTAVWTGSRMVVWGGCGAASGCFTRLDTGGLYDPVADSWSPTTTTGGPGARYLHSAVWTGSRMIAWGGCVDTECSTQTFTGGSFDPVANAWSPVATANGPSARASQSAVWTGSEMIVWGGCYGGQCQLVLNSGGRYDPSSDSWVPTSIEDGPTARLNHSAVWTGSEMIVWGGFDAIGQTYTGKRYDPATDHWVATNFIGSPLARDQHTAVWTGTEMIVWGGQVQGIGAANSGGRYDPTTDTWIDTTFTGAPSARQDHDAVWTGSRMIVWGGCAFNSLCDAVVGDGGRYDPSTDSWQPMSTVDAPSPRSAFPAVWSGQEMIVWGGRLGDLSPVATGARYDPSSDTWSPMAVAGAPSARFSHAGVWDGSGLIVWAGRDGESALGDGARYDPVSDSWTPISAAGAPQPRTAHSYVWTGDRLVVWGGCPTPGCDAPLFTGGQYVPASDTWTATGTLSNAPFDRYDHTAVWAGTRMLVWGGWHTVNGTQTNTGAAYCPGGGGSATWEPSAPSAMTASAVSSSRVDLSWVDNSIDESGFKIDRCTGDLSTCDSNPVQYWAWLGNVGANVTSFSDMTRLPTTTYSYRVRATNAGGDSAFSNSAAATTLDVPPAAPSGESATATPGPQVNVAWADNSRNEQGFEIERCTGTAVACDGNPAGYAQITQTAADVTSYVDTTVLSDTTYSYRTRAFNSGGSSAYSNSASASTNTGPATPGEASEAGATPLLVTGYDRTTGEVTVSFDPACTSTDHAAYSGPLGQVDLLQWDRAVCGLGVSGTATFDPGAGDRYFVIVGQSTTAEGSYGSKSDGTQRPEAVGVGICDQTQDLSNPCP